MEFAKAIMAPVAVRASAADFSCPRDQQNRGYPDLWRGPGLRFVDVDEDGYDDIVFSNAERF